MTKIMKRRFVIIFLLFAAALLVRSLAAGLHYYPIVDDSIQYINFQKSTDFLKLITTEGLFASRPLAVLVDIFFAGPFHDVLIIPVMMIAVLHGLSGTLFLRLFERYFGSGAVFAVIFALLPLGCEGVHWLSASTRIVFGLLFCAAAANVFEDFISGGGWWRVPLFAVLSLASYGFYEQILALSFTLTVLQAFRYRKNRRALAAIAAPVMLSLYFVFTAVNASDGSVGARMQLALPTSVWYFKVFLPDLLSQMGGVFVKGGVMTLLRGFVRGFTSSFSGILYVILSAGLGVGIYFASRRLLPRTEQNTALCATVWGVLLFAAPLSPYFIIANPYFTLRAAVPAFVGAALVIDTLMRSLIRRDGVYSVSAGVLAAVFLIAGASEVRDYYAVGKYDEMLARKLLSYSDSFEGRVGILGLEAKPPCEVNFYFNGHIVSCGASDWSLYGKLASLCDEPPEFSPIPLGLDEYPFYRSWNADVKRIDGFDQVWLFNEAEMTLTRLTVIPEDGENAFGFMLPDGTYIGRIYEENGMGYADIP